MKIVIITNWCHIHVVDVKEGAPIHMKNISSNDGICTAFPFVEVVK